MLDPVIVVRKRASGVVGRIDVDALDLASKILFEGFQSEKVVAKNETVVEDIVV